MKTKNRWGMCTMIAILLGLLISLYSCGDKCKCNGDCHGTQCSAPCADDCRCTYITEKSNSVVGKWKSTWDNGYAILTFNTDGSGSFVEGWDNNVDNATFYYKYDGETYLLTLMVNGKEPYKIVLEWINNNTFYISDPHLVDENIETIWKRQ